MSAVRGFLASMTGRFFLVLVIGVAISAAVAWSLADGKRQAELRRLDLERSADRTEDALSRWSALTPESRPSFRLERSRGLRRIGDDAAVSGPDVVATELLKARVPGVAVTVEHAAAELCRSPFGPGVTVPGRRCWVVTAAQSGQTLKLLVETPPRPVSDSPLFDPLYLAVLVLAAAGLALLVSRMAAAPLSSLAQAATDLGGDLARQPMPLAGPTEVRRAAEAFNAMQARLQRQMSERTHMLAAITHDLQTPVTRLRLRLEKVGDAELRERLLADLGAMQTLIREGLELARAADHSEEVVTLDLRSLVESLVEDAADAGQPVTLGDVMEADIRARPEALRRTLLNLVDNALKYGGSAEVSIVGEAGSPVVRVRDHGAGLPDDQVEEVFQPFVRLEESRSRETGGAGLGLTIARTLAERNGATVTLRNHPDGGAEAVVRFGPA